MMKKGERKYDWEKWKWSFLAQTESIKTSLLNETLFRSEMNSIHCTVHNYVPFSIAPHLLYRLSTAHPKPVQYVPCQHSQVTVIIVLLKSNNRKYNKFRAILFICLFIY